MSDGREEVTREEFEELSFVVEIVVEIMLSRLSPSLFDGLKPESDRLLSGWVAKRLHILVPGQDTNA